MIYSNRIVTLKHENTCSLVNSKICISFPKGTFYLIGPVHNDSLTGLVTRWFGCLLTVMDCKRGICRQAGHVVKEDLLSIGVKYFSIGNTPKEITLL